MSSIQTQFLNLKAHHAQYPAIDPKTALKGSASGKIIFIAGASQGIGQATAVAFAQAGAQAIYVTARSEKALLETKTQISQANPAINRLCEFVNVDHGGEGIKCFAVHPGGVLTVLAKNMPKELHANLVDEPDLAAGFVVWLCSGQADWAKGRYLSSNWDVDELMQLKDRIVENDLLVNRLRTKA
jgi:NAD(P)-dependent dehydrogenase (short-subunit alcohol dehydrogenase family)